MSRHSVLVLDTASTKFELKNIANGFFMDHGLVSKSYEPVIFVGMDVWETLLEDREAFVDATNIATYVILKDLTDDALQVIGGGFDPRHTNSRTFEKDSLEELMYEDNKERIAESLKSLTLTITVFE